MNLKQIANKTSNISLFPLLLIFLVMIGIGCNSSSENAIPVTVESPQADTSTSNESVDAVDSPETTNNEQAYPGKAADEAYPAPDIYENLTDELPNPEVDLPTAAEATGVVGGVLVREVLEEGYEPLIPVTLSLAAVINSSEGQPAFIRANSESPQAQLFPTGIFVFSDVPPGEYGLMVDVGYTQFPIKDDGDWPLLITVESGKAIDMGQVITQLP